MRKVCFDYDALLFKACCAVEKRSIKVLHKSGKVFEFKTRTDFYGHWKKKAGGWLANNPEYILDDFTIEDIKEVEPIENALALLKRTIQDTIADLGTTDYYGYYSGEGNFRKDICTLLPYKGNRDKNSLPFHLQAAKDYLHLYHNGRASKDREPDDLVCTDMYSALKTKQDLVCAVFEKDYLGCEGDWYYFDQKNLLKIRGYGKLMKTTKGVSGRGRIFKYFQIAASDSSDNYQAHCFSNQKNGDITAYNVLKDCTNDKQAFEALKEHFKYLYPKPITITNWKGDSFEINWLYVLQEMFSLAHLERWKGDRVNVEKVFKKLGIEI